jgi:4-amino-4-deoxy-L-arabinose transferase-like glycosyltransferase
MRRTQHLRPHIAIPGAWPAWLAMFALALAVRLAYVSIAVGPDAAPGSGAVAYDAVAWNLAGGTGFSLESPTGRHPTASVAPLVPWLVSLVYRAVGHRYFAALLMQCLVGALVPLLLAAFGRSLFGDPVGRWSGWIASIHPLLVRVSGDLLAETTFCAALLLALCLSAEWVRTPRGGRALGVGLAWGIATLTRPAALLLPVVIAAWAWPPLGVTLGGRARARHAALVALGLALVVGPWTLRNAIALRSFVPVTTGGGGAMMAANNPVAWDHPTGRVDPGGATDQAARAAEFQGLNEVERDERAGARAWTFVRGRWRDWPGVALARLAGFWRPGVDAPAAGRGPATPGRRADLFFVWSAITFPFALWGIARSLRGARRWFQSLPLLVIVSFMLIAVVLWGSPQVRLPVEPLVALFAALGLDDAHRRLRARRHGLTVVPGRGRLSPGDR